MIIDPKKFLKEPITKDNTYSPEEIMRAFDFKNLEECDGDPLHYADSPQVLDQAKRGHGKFARLWRDIKPTIEMRRARHMKSRVIRIRH